MKEITEEEAYRLAEGGDEFPIIIKEENEESESAVCLKKFPTGYILGVSCDKKDLFKLFYSEDYETIKGNCDKYIQIMNETGNPFGEEMENSTF